MEPFTRLEDAGRFLEQRVYDHFRQTSEWPRARDFDLDYPELLDPLGGLEVVCRQIGTERISCGSPMSESDRVALRLPTLATCEGAETDVANFLAAVRLAADRYHAARGKDAELKVADLVEALKIDELAARRAIELILSGSGVSGGGGGGRVSLALLASRMRGVAIHSSRSRFAARLNSGVRPRPTSRLYSSNRSELACTTNLRPLSNTTASGSSLTPPRFLEQTARVAPRTRRARAWLRRLPSSSRIVVKMAFALCHQTRHVKR